MRTNITLFAIVILFVLLGFGGRAFAEYKPVRSAEEILAGQETNPSRDAIRELFINGSQRAERYAKVAAGCKQALIILGITVIPALLEDYLSSQDLLFGIALDQIVGSAGHPATEYLIPYLKNSDSYTRRSAAYLIGRVSKASNLTDPTALGPLDDDLSAITALKNALAVETDWHVIRAFLDALGSMRDPAMIIELVRYLDNPEQAVRLSAVIAIGRIPNQRAVVGLIMAFKDEEMTVREAAVLALSSPTMGSIAIRSHNLQGMAASPSKPLTERLCAVEAIARYLEAIAPVSSDDATFARKHGYELRSIIDNTIKPGDWQLCGYIVVAIGFTWMPEAKDYLQTLKLTEKHPFVLQKIDEALQRLDAGQPLPPPEK